jgi:hypothetical protein
MADIRKKNDINEPVTEMSAVEEIKMIHEAEPAQTEPAPAEEEKAQPTAEKAAEKAEPAAERFPDIWPDEDKPGKKAKTAIVLSGITGTNSAQNSNRVNPMKRPGITSAPKKTGIKETSTNTTYGIPVSVGAGVKIDFAPRWSVGVGLNYSLLSRKFYGTYTRVGENGNILKDVSSDIRATQHYIGIPVNAYYNIVENKFVNFYAYAGGTVEKCVSDEYRVLTKDILHKERVKGVQASANIGIGAEFMLGNHLGIYIDPSARYYFNCNQPKSIRTAQPLMLGFEMGLRVRL